MKVEKIDAWRVETDEAVYLRLLNDKFERKDIWYAGTKFGFIVVNDATADPLEAAFQRSVQFDDLEAMGKVQ